MDEPHSRAEDQSGHTSASHGTAKTNGGLICISFMVFKLCVLWMFSFPPSQTNSFAWSLISPRKGNARLAAELCTSPHDESAAKASFLSHVLSRRHFILEADSSKAFDFSFLFFFFSVSVIDDQGGEVCDSHFPLQYSHPVSKI